MARITCSVWLVCHGVMCRPRSEVFRNGLPYRVLLEAPHPSAPALQHFSVFNPLQIPTSGHRSIFLSLLLPKTISVPGFPGSLALLGSRKVEAKESAGNQIYGKETSKKSSIYLEGKSMTPLRGNTILLRISKQLHCLGLGVQGFKAVTKLIKLRF